MSDRSPCGHLYGHPSVAHLPLEQQVNGGNHAVRPNATVVLLCAGWLSTAAKCSAKLSSASGLTA
eukprot:355453-Chlamydomonas_euryale.AAC.4